jgi:hypothetical protein
VPAPGRVVEAIAGVTQLDRAADEQCLERRPDLLRQRLPGAWQGDADQRDAAAIGEQHHAARLPRGPRPSRPPRLPAPPPALAMDGANNSANSRKRLAPSLTAIVFSTFVTGGASAKKEKTDQ